MQSIQLLYSQLSGSRRIVVTMHQKPDPDAMGSSLALARFLKNLGNQVTVVSPTNWPEFLDWMPGVDEVIDFESNMDFGSNAILTADWIFCLDFNVLYRVKKLMPLLQECSAVRILIDHHESPHTSSFHYGVNIINKSSTSELVYDMILDAGYRSLIDSDTAACLYAGVMSDTGSFRFPATTSSVHIMVADLMATGFQHTTVHQNIFDNYFENRLRFIGHLLSHRLQVFYEYNAALIYVTRSDLLKFDIQTGDTEGIVNYPLSIRGIQVAALLIDREEERRWSFRSKDVFDCNRFARTHFEGGGHHNAAGGRSILSIEQNITLFKTVLPLFLQS